MRCQGKNKINVYKVSETPENRAKKIANVYKVFMKNEKMLFGDTPPHVSR